MNGISGQFKITRADNIHLVYEYIVRIFGNEFKATSTLIRFQMKTELFFSGYSYRPHYNAENDHRKLSHSETLSRVERFENDTF